MHFFTSSQCFWMVLTLQNLKLGGNLEFSWYSCNILRYCSNRCIVWFFIPTNCPAQANRKFPVQLYVKIKFSLSRHFEYANEQITYNFWLWEDRITSIKLCARISSKMATIDEFVLKKYWSLMKVWNKPTLRRMKIYYYWTNIRKWNYFNTSFIEDFRK
jgi:hypothetical protein